MFERQGQSGLKQGNALAEKRHSEVQMTARALLDSAGLPSCVWIYAAPYGTLMTNAVRPAAAGITPYAKFTVLGSTFPMFLLDLR